MGGGRGKVTILANGQKAGSFTITPEDSDVMRQISLAENLKAGYERDHACSTRANGSLLYQIVGRCYVPWSQGGQPQPGQEPMSIAKSLMTKPRSRRTIRQP